MFDDIKISIWKRIWWKVEKIYDFFRYNIPHFTINIWSFRKELWNYRAWDSSYDMLMFARGLELLSNNLEKYSLEVDKDRIPKIKSCKRAIELLRYHANDSFLELAEKQLNKEFDAKFTTKPSDTPGYVELVDETPEKQQQINKELHELSSKIYKETWDELFDILKKDLHGWWY